MKGDHREKKGEAIWFEINLEYVDCPDYPSPCPCVKYTIE